MNSKLLHIIAGLGISAVIAIPCYYVSHSLVVALYSCLSGVIAGVIKEWCDKIYTGKYDKKDFYATCLGSLIMIIIFILVHVL